MATLLSQVPVPDMADSIWAAIAVQMDAMGDSADGMDIPEHKEDEDRTQMTDGADAPQVTVDADAPQMTADENAPQVSVSGDAPQSPVDEGTLQIPGDADTPQMTEGANTPNMTGIKEAEAVASAANSSEIPDLTSQSKQPTHAEEVDKSKIARIFGKITTGGWISLASAAAAAVAGSFMLTLHTKQPVLPAAPSRSVPQKTLIVPNEDSFSVDPDNIITLPAIRMSVPIDSLLFHPDTIQMAPQTIDTPAVEQTEPMADPVAPPPATLPPAAPTTEQPKTKKPKGVGGITDDDYKIGVKKDSTIKNE
ncbi:hypothetical protein [Chitinophaga sp. sic0106]|uniref:hypothetical protein n=1 Tax=Chitinophaga sp. sic0106 TaxID=2854785 RepID=UPI001C43CC1D|nr:hypothetical protein [Chitinophaga sp. sic0106]MBV7532170.1 hypothetical protein [Chitinophaga sp. sic0106]